MKAKKIEVDKLPEEAKKALSHFPEFTICEFNESGANGFVMLGNHEVLKKEVALKIYFHEKNDINQEPTLVASITHDNVLKVYDARKVEDTCSYYMTPAANDGDLSDFLEKYYLNLSLSHSLLCQLLSGLSALHNPMVGLVHRDLKPENLLVHDETLLIADFGSVRKISEATGKAPASKHSILYRPPEAFGDSAFFDASSDVYQAGFIGYLLFGGALDNELTQHLNKKQKAELKEIDSEQGNFESSQYVDGCIENLACRGKLLQWDSLPYFVPRAIIRILKNATKPHGSRYSNVSEFLIDLAKARNNLPEWSLCSDGALLENWKGNDYFIDKFGLKKRGHGKSQFRRDNSLKADSPEKIFAQLRTKLKLP